MKEREHQSIEWKEIWQDEYLKWICGYANAHGGTIYIGTDDNGNVVGIDNARDLFAEILIKGISQEIKRGLGKEYILKQSQLSNPKGKFNITESIKNSAIQKKQLVCEYDEFSINSYLNRIIKTTSLLLIKSDISLERKKSLKRLMIYFNEVEELNPFTINWKIQFNKKLEQKILLQLLKPIILKNS